METLAHYHGQGGVPDESDEVPLRVSDVVPGLEGEELADELGQAVGRDGGQHLLLTALQTDIQIRQPIG